jgi:hypothetical protein
MGLQHEEIASPSMLEALAPGYLGNPEVVGGLLSRFLADSEADLRALGAGTLASAAFGSAARERIDGLSSKLSGKDPAYPPVKGWSGVSLPGALIAALGSFWRERRGSWGDDAVAVLLEWLLVRLADHWKAANGDDAVLSTLLGPDQRSAMNLLLGRYRTA